METIFSNLLVQLRTAAGFPTAYRFYHDSGGKNVLKLSYRAYLMVEQGKNLPVADRLGTFIWALRLFPKTAEANAFVSAWLQTAMGPENFRDFIAPLLSAHTQTPGLSPMQQAMKKSITAKTHYLTVEQVTVIHASTNNYLCFLAIGSDTGIWKIKEFAGCLKLSESEAEKSLKALTSVKLVKQVRKGAYSSPLAGAFKTYPNLDTLTPELREKIRDCDRKLAASGQEIYPRNIIVRADELDFRNFFPIIDVNLDAAGTYNVNKKTEHSALFMVEGKITKLRDF